MTPEVRVRQRRRLLLLAGFLITCGLAALFFLTRIPLPARLLLGLSDLIVGAVLLVLVRQKYGGGS
jgi:hypothetical protein